MDDRPPAGLDVVGIGSMAVDRVHRTVRILGLDEKGMLQDVDERGPVVRAIGGVVLNHLGWAAVLGLRTGIFGRQGDDEDGRLLRAAMDELGIEKNLILGDAPTTFAEIFVDAGAGRTIYMAPGATAETDAAHIREFHSDFIRRARRVSTEVSQLPLDAVREVLRIAREAGIPTVLDLDVPPSDALATLGDEETLDQVLRAADVLKPSKLAVRELVEDAGDDPLALARAVAKRYGNSAVVVTDGEAGCGIAAGDGGWHVPAARVDAVDTTGAGDAFLGGLLVALDSGLDWETAGNLANACGAACVQQLGAFPEDPERARALVRELYRGQPVPGLAGSFASAVSQVTAQEAGADAALQVLETGASQAAELNHRHVEHAGVAFSAAASLIESARSRGGRVHVTGVGKPEHVAHYAASLLSSTGTPATFLHATESLHGSLGQLEEGDVVIAISNSGNTPELAACVEAVKRRDCRVIAVTGGIPSRLADAADVILDAGVAHEGGPLGLAPRASVAAEILVVAALSGALQERAGFSRADYAARHPAGALGKKARDGDEG